MTEADQNLSGNNAEGIAIVGMSGRFPGASDVSQFWANIKNGVETISRFTPEELDLPVPEEDIEEDTAKYVCAKGRLDDIDMFDARFFGYLPREAEVMDPQHRVFLEICSEALEHAGYDPFRYHGSIGCYGGCYMDTYVLWNLCSKRGFLANLINSIQVGSLQTELGNDKDYLATRVAYKLGLRGPSMTLQTACSTSLVAIATACQSLESYSCDMALAGGVTIVLPQKKGYFYKEGGMLSPDGRCRPFDADAAGTVFSNGAAVLLLKRLEDAVQDGDQIYAVIHGYAMNNDGGDKVSYTAPSVDGQAEAIALALGMGGIDPRSIGYVEAHGTATPIGDPIEIAGLTKAYGGETQDRQYCSIGSVKANLGHLDCASGAIGLIKTALSIHEGVIPPLINFKSPNPRIAFDKTPFYVTTELTKWSDEEKPRIAGVSSFGVGGTNAHVVVGQYRDTRDISPSRARQLLLLSARSEAAVAEQADRLAAHLAANPDIPLADVSYTLQVGRRLFEQRRFVVASSAGEAVERLRKPAAASERGTPKVSKPSLVFMFPGQGTQYPGMARELYRSEETFRNDVDSAAEALIADSDFAIDLRRNLLCAPDDPDHDRLAQEAAQTRYAQPLIFIVEIALARLLGRWGIQPAAVIGHSIGEFAAACLAGVYSLEDAVRLVAVRGRLMQEMPTGQMLAVRAPREEVAALLPDGLVIAAVNSPGVTVVSGATETIHEFAATLERESVQASVLKTSHAFHSPMMAAAHDPLVAFAQSVKAQSSSLEVISTASGQSGTADMFSDPAYWGKQLVSPVLFCDAVRSAAEADPGRVFLEVGPGQTLSAMARQSLAGEADRTVCACLGPLQAPGSDVENLLGAVGRLWISGAMPDWDALHIGRRRIPLPTYPFERKRYWVDPVPMSQPDHQEEDTRTLPAAHTVNEIQTNGHLSDEELLVKQQLQIIAAQLRMFGSSG